MKHFLCLVLLVLILTGCTTASTTNPAWRQTLKQELPELGHRNWIVVADSAYPLQTSPGVETIYTGAGQIDVVKAVLAALDETEHVKPIVHLDAELSAVPESLAPGIDAYRSELKILLKGRRVVTMPHEQLIATLDDTGKTFHVLILKTTLTIPYTSVFLQLDCAYWGPDSEKQLREIIAAQPR
jgi:hypothetical protein